MYARIGAVSLHCVKQNIVRTQVRCPKVHLVGNRPNGSRHRNHSLTVEGGLKFQNIRTRTSDKAASGGSGARAIAVSEPITEEEIQQKTELPLSQENLSEIAADGLVNIPRFKRELTSDRPVIVHLGVGGFHRSHQAYYLHELLSKGSNWALVGMGVLDFDSPMRDALKAQDYLYTLISRSATETDYTVVGSMLDFVHSPDDKAAALERLADPQTKIVSLTITEKGYCWDTNQHLDRTHPFIVEDLKDIMNPTSAPGHIVAGLKLRKERGMKPFTVLSCDNMPDNGRIAKTIVTELAREVDEELADWIETEVPFPVTMVDRITPITTQKDKDVLKAETGIVDQWPVVAEDFHQWVIEDNFVDGVRPEFDEVGALVVEDVIPYECMKIRLLNGGHSALAYMGYLIGYRDVDKALNDVRLTSYLEKYFAEIAPTVPPVPGVDIEEYQKSLIRRFTNENIEDKLQRLAQDGSAKFYNTMKEPIEERIADGQSVDMPALALASFARYMTGCDEYGDRIMILDPLSDELTSLAAKMYDNVEVDFEKRDLTNVISFLGAVFGPELPRAHDNVFSEKVLDWAFTLHEEGCSSTCGNLMWDVNEDTCVHVGIGPVVSDAYPNLA